MTKKNPSILSLYDKESASATELRRILSNIKSCGNDECKTILVTSAAVDEGKSITSSLLGITAANVLSSKVVIVDFDLRKPKIHHYFSMSNNPGLSDVVSGEMNLNNVTKNVVIPNLKVITAGNTKKSVTELIDNTNLISLFDELKFYYDIVIIDSPPIIPVSDSLLLANQVDGVLMVVRAGSTPKMVASRAMNLLKATNTNILGVVLNDVENILPYYYRDKYYRYSYSHSK